MELKIEEELEFDFYKFNWNVYMLEDGAILKAIYLPTKIFKTGVDSFNVPTYITAGIVTVTAIVDKELKGKPSQEPFDSKKHKSILVNFEPQDERWNLFSLSDGNLLKIKLIVSSIRKAEMYNTFGEPIYYVSHNISYATIKED